MYIHILDLINYYTYISFLKIVTRASVSLVFFLSPYLLHSPLSRDMRGSVICEYLPEARSFHLRETVHIYTLLFLVWVCECGAYLERTAFENSLSWHSFARNSVLFFYFEWNINGNSVWMSKKKWRLNHRKRKDFFFVANAFFGAFRGVYKTIISMWSN